MKLSDEQIGALVGMLLSDGHILAALQHQIHDFYFLKLLKYL